MPSLVCRSLTFTWPSGETVFADLDATFPDGRTGLVGRNGGGKSTLLQILAGRLPPTSGAVSGPPRIGYLPQQLVLEDSRTVAEVLEVADALVALRRVTAGLGAERDFAAVGDRWDLEDRIAAELAAFGFAGLDLDRRIGTLSGGEVVLLALTGLLIARPDVLLLDEPTNNLDAAARARLSAAMERWRGPAVLISHDRELLERMDAIGELRDGAIRFVGGGYAAFTDAVAAEQEAASRAVRTAQADLRRQQRELTEMRTKLDRRQRFARSQAGSQPKIVAGAKKRAAQVSAGKLNDSHQADVAEARRTLASAEERVRDDELIDIDLSATSVPAGRDVLVGDRFVLRTGQTVSLHLRGPERIGLVGPNGAGKTTLIDTVRGRLAPTSGTVEIRVPWRLLPQRLQLLDDRESVLAAVERFAPAADANALRAGLARFLLGADAVLRPVGTLSGGERFRVTLAALLLAEPPPQLLILDEPTNNLDLDSVAQLVAALRAYRGALLVASHDVTFLGELNLTGRLDLATDGPVAVAPV